MTEQKIGLDSNCLSYLLDAITHVSEPSGELKDERIAIVRAWFYVTGTYYVSETVISECARIRDTDRQKLHTDFITVLLFDEPARNSLVIKTRAENLLSSHRKPNDCRVLAEGEDIGLDTLLTCDYDFRTRLAGKSPDTKLVKPSDFWSSLNIPRGACPKVIPDKTHALFEEVWWRW